MKLWIQRYRLIGTIDSFEKKYLEATVENVNKFWSIRKRNLHIRALWDKKVEKSPIYWFFSK